MSLDQHRDAAQSFRSAPRGNAGAPEIGRLHVDAPEALPSVEPAATDPALRAHAVQFYEATPFLVDQLRRYVDAGLRLDETVILIATAQHRQALEERLAADGIDLDDARMRGQYIALDAAETLDRFMVNGAPNEDRFLETVGRTIAHTTAGGHQVRAFGEMVALLAADGQFDAAVRLEQLWNDLQSTYPFSLLCAYPLDILGGERLAGVFDRICAEHTRVAPAESYTTLTEPGARLRAITLLQQKAQSLEAEIAERQRAEQRLQALLATSVSVAVQNGRLYREAQDALHQRDEFLTIAAHELRTPLTTIRAHAQLMLRRLRRHGSADWPAVERAFATITQQTGRLSRLIEQLLDVSRLDANTLTLALQLTDLRELVERVAGTAVVDAVQRIEVEAAPDIRAWVDPLRVEQVLTNLLENAARYGPADAPIEVALARCPDGQVQLSVRDHGAGIPEAKRSRLFERFFQGHSEGYQSGMGLGLYLSRQIAELHGGQIAVELPPSGGTRFVVRLPIVPEAP